MFSRVWTAAILGVSASPVRVEADLSGGLPGFTIVGLPTAQIREAQDRVKTAMKNADLTPQLHQITINLTPADMKKEGSGFDLPIAAAIMGACGMIPSDRLGEIMMTGELSLDGSVLGVNGVLAAAMLAKEQKIPVLVVPKENVREAELVEDLTVVGIGSLGELADFLRFGIVPEYDPASPVSENTGKQVDFADLHGQNAAKRAALIAAAGFHNMLLVGPPGTGKTMIARRIPTILPPPGRDELLEIARILSIAGLRRPDGSLRPERPFRSPHHTASPQALSGGGIIPRPGEVTLAHRGVLFLDEMPEFSRAALEILRQPMEDREIVISRASGTYRFPADFLLVAAMNPCPCGYFPDRSRCSCSPQSISRYMQRISRPLLDRIDLCAEAAPISYEALTGGRGEEVTSSAMMREKVTDTAEIQEKRYQEFPWHFNAEIPAASIRDFCILTPEAEELIKKAYQGFGLSARAFHRILKTSRTIADLEKEKTISARHMSEALFYRPVESRMKM